MIQIIKRFIAWLNGKPKAVLQKEPEKAILTKEEKKALRDRRKSRKPQRTRRPGLRKKENQSVQYKRERAEK